VKDLVSSLQKIVAFVLVLGGSIMLGISRSLAHLNSNDYDWWAARLGYVDFLVVILLLFIISFTFGKTIVREKQRNKFLYILCAIISFSSFVSMGALTGVLVFLKTYSEDYWLYSIPPDAHFYLALVMFVMSLVLQNYSKPKTISVEKA